MSGEFFLYCPWEQCFYRCHVIPFYITTTAFLASFPFSQGSQGLEFLPASISPTMWHIHILWHIYSSHMPRICNRSLSPPTLRADLREPHELHEPHEPQLQPSLRIGLENVFDPCQRPYIYIMMVVFGAIS